MGDPKKARKKYRRPSILWQKDMIDEQRELLKEYGLKNKKEIWRVESLLKKFREQAKKLIANDTEQGKKEREVLIKKLVKLNLINASAKLEDILVLNLKNILDRRLQTIVFNKDFARSIKQARQFVVHRHISINDKKVNIPSYLVMSDEENKISFSKNSALMSEEHPERAKEKEEKEKIKKEKIVKKEEKPKEKKEDKKKPKDKVPKKEKVKVEETKEKVKIEEVPKKEEVKKEIKKKEPKVEKVVKAPKEEKKVEELKNVVPEERKTHKEK